MKEIQRPVVRNSVSEIVAFIRENEIQKDDILEIFQESYQDTERYILVYYADIEK